MEYNMVFEGDDLKVVSVSQIKKTKHGGHYREIVFDRHPNPAYRNKQFPVPAVREFHRNESDFLGITPGQVMHSVKIYAKSMGIKGPGKLYSLEEYDGYIVGKHRD